MSQLAFPMQIPAPVIKRSALFGGAGRLRLELKRWWAEGKQVCFIGLNPSTADHQVDDPTVKRWIHFAQQWGYAGFTAVNLFPFRSSSPAECRKWADWESRGPDWYTRDDIYFSNMPHVAKVAKAADLVVACWGCCPWAYDVIEAVVEEITCEEEPWPDIYCFGKTLNGDPIHPMARGKHRVPNDARPILWREGPKP